MKRTAGGIPVLCRMLAIGFLTAALTSFVLAAAYGRVQFRFLGDFCAEIIERDPDSRPLVREILKAAKSGAVTQREENILESLGYRTVDFFSIREKIWLSAGLGVLAGCLLLLAAVRRERRRTEGRVRELTEYLEKVNTGRPGLLTDVSEDEFSCLQDEIYKTVTNLYQTREAAVTAKKNFADNLSNIAHQLKTPITAISLANQRMREHSSCVYPERIKRQLDRLVSLEESLLLLSRLDAGTLALQRTHADVFTLLTLAADHLRELSDRSGVSIEIPEIEETNIWVDFEWTMEAIMNLLKNGMEHTEKGGAVRCTCEKNPLYVQIRIRDEGPGFAREDLPHLFERFYRGQNAKGAGIGIGLSLAREILEMENGTIRAWNLSSGGACFEIRFYSLPCH